MHRSLLGVYCLFLARMFNIESKKRLNSQFQVIRGCLCKLEVLAWVLLK